MLGILFSGSRSSYITIIWRSYSISLILLHYFQDMYMSPITFSCLSTVSSATTNVTYQLITSPNQTRKKIVSNNSRRGEKSFAPLNISQYSPKKKCFPYTLPSKWLVCKSEAIKKILISDTLQNKKKPNTLSSPKETMTQLHLYYDPKKY